MVAEPLPGSVMSEPTRPIPDNLEEASSSATTRGQSWDVRETIDSKPIAGPGAVIPNPPPVPAERVSTVADDPGSVPGDVLAQTIADSEAPPPALDDQSDTFQLATPAPSDGSSTGPDEAAPPLLRDVAGYKILKVLGQGGMGVVYKARQRGLKRIVALKMISAAGLHGPADLCGFAARRWPSPICSIPTSCRSTRSAKTTAIPSSRSNTSPAAAWPRRSAALRARRARPHNWCKALAGGMEYAHQRGIIHRDLKPANVLLTEAGEPKVSDFGLVKRLEDDAGQTQSGSILGTPSYMAPEQAEGKIKEIGPCSDIYALGGVLYEMLTAAGRRSAPHRCWTRLQQVRTQEPIPPSQFQPKVPRDLETICLKCLQKDPAKRYATAGALGEDLRRFLSGEAILARPVSRAERLWRWCLRNPEVAALSGGRGDPGRLSWAGTSTLLYRLSRANERTAVANASDRQQQRVRSPSATPARPEPRRRRHWPTPRRHSATPSWPAPTRPAPANRKQVAKGIAQDAIVQMIHLGEQLMRRLKTKPDPARAEAEWLRLREDLLVDAPERAGSPGRADRAPGSQPFAFATLHQRLGDLLRRLGQVEDARASSSKATTGSHGSRRTSPTTTSRVPTWV